MANIFSDDFNRADSTNLGANWTEESGNPEVKDNMLRQPPGAVGFCYYSSAVSTADYSVSFDWDSSQTHGGLTKTWVEPIIRASGTTKWDNCYFCLYYHTSFAIGMYKKVAGTQTALGSWTADNTFTGLINVRFEANGSTLTAYCDASDELTQTDTSHSSAGYGGIRFTGDDSIQCFVDNFSIDDLTSGGDPPAATFIPRVTMF